VARDGQRLKPLVTRLATVGPELAVLEATGGFEITVAGAAVAAGLPLAVVNPARIRAFARAIGRLAKTDRLDAELIARFAEQVRPEPRPVLDEQAQILAELVARRRQLVEMIGMEQPSAPGAQRQDCARHRAHTRGASGGPGPAQPGQVRSSRPRARPRTF
jgi:transposase